MPPAVLASADPASLTRRLRLLRDTVSSGQYRPPTIVASGSGGLRIALDLLDRAVRRWTPAHSGLTHQHLPNRAPIESPTATDRHQRRTPPLPSHSGIARSDRPCKMHSQSDQRSGSGSLLSGRLWYWAAIAAYYCRYWGRLPQRRSDQSTAAPCRHDRRNHGRHFFWFSRQRIHQFDFGIGIGRYSLHFMHSSRPTRS